LIKEDYIQNVIAQMHEGIDFDAIKRNLKKNGLNSDEIAHIMRRADSIFLDEVQVKGHNRIFFIAYKLWIAYGLIFFGLAITFYSMIANGGIGGYYIFYYGPIFSGLAIIAVEQRKRISQSRKRQGSPYDKWR